MPSARLEDFSSSREHISYLTGLFSSWAIYLCTGLSSLELLKDRSPVETVITFATVSGELLSPWTFLFTYCGTDAYFFVTTLIDMIPYIMWILYLLLKTNHSVEFKWYVSAVLMLELKVSAFFCLAYGDTAALYVRSGGACFAAFIPVFYAFFWKRWNPSVIHMLSVVLRITTSASELLFDDNIGDVFSNIGLLKLFRLLTFASAFVNLIASLGRVCHRKWSQSEKVPPGLPTQGTHVNNHQPFSLYQRKRRVGTQVESSTIA